MSTDRGPPLGDSGDVATPDVYPFATVGEYSGEPYPDWIRGLDGRNGVYLIRLRDSGEIAYIGESHTERLYGTLTRHFQRWSPKYNTAGPTYDRSDVDVAVVLVPKTHAQYLQNELICALNPQDNRLVCGEISTNEEYPYDEYQGPPRGYDYHVEDILDGVFFEFYDDDDDIPF